MVVGDGFRHRRHRQQIFRLRIASGEQSAQLSIFQIYMVVGWIQPSKASPADFRCGSPRRTVCPSCLYSKFYGGGDDSTIEGIANNYSLPRLSTSVPQGRKKNECEHNSRPRPALQALFLHTNAIYIDTTFLVIILRHLMPDTLSVTNYPVPARFGFRSGHLKEMMIKRRPAIQNSFNGCGDSRLCQPDRVHWCTGGRRV